MEGHKEDPRATERRGRGGGHTPQSIVGRLTSARVSHPLPSYPMKTQT